jgi:hypothetical protein
MTQQRKMFVAVICFVACFALILCANGCSWHQRNEARFVLAPWDWVAPTPYELSDNLVEGFDVQVSLRTISPPSPETGLNQHDVDKSYCWAKRIVGSDAKGGKMDKIMVPNWVAISGADSLVFRQRSRVCDGHKVWSGKCYNISKPFLSFGDFVWYETNRF